MGVGRDNVLAEGGALSTAVDRRWEKGGDTAAPKEMDSARSGLGGMVVGGGVGPFPVRRARSGIPNAARRKCYPASKYTPDVGAAGPLAAYGHAFGYRIGAIRHIYQAYLRFAGDIGAIPPRTARIRKLGRWVGRGRRRAGRDARPIYSDVGIREISNLEYIDFATTQSASFSPQCAFCVAVSDAYLIPPLPYILQ